MIKIHMFQACKGDCLLVQINPETIEEMNILIDCGYNYRNGIKPQLKRIINNGKKIDRFIITHYDEDHIQGAIKLIHENGNAHVPNLFSIEQVWLNTYTHMRHTHKSSFILSERERIIIEAFNSGNNAKLAIDKLNENINAEEALILGRQIKNLEYSLNTDFNGLMVSTDNRKHITISENIAIFILSPDDKKLDEVEYEFRKAIYNLIGLKDSSSEDILSDAFELHTQVLDIDHHSCIDENISSTDELITNEKIIELSKCECYKADDSPANGSSIAFVLEVNDYRILFMADSHSEIVENSLKLLYPKEEVIVFDAIKVSHHGSKGNTSPNLLRMIDSSRYLFSTNAKSYCHPDVETIARIINRPILDSVDYSVRDLIFNYELEHIKPFRKKELMNIFNYNIVVKQKIEF